MDFLSHTFSTINNTLGHEDDQYEYISCAVSIYREFLKKSSPSDNHNRNSLGGRNGSQMQRVNHNGSSLSESETSKNNLNLIQAPSGRNMSKYLTMMVNPTSGQRQTNITSRIDSSNYL